MYRKEIRNAKIKQNDRLIMSSENKHKAAWSIINKEIGISREKESTTISPNEFNNYFVNVATSANDSPCSVATGYNGKLKCNKIKNNNLLFTWNEVTPETIVSIIKNFKTSGSEDYYGFTNATIKNILDLIVQPLTYLINWMFIEGVFPECLKISVTVPIHKKGNTNSPNNYRPISLVPVFSKIIEHCMKQQLSQYFENNNLFNSSQFGFRKNLSTIKAVEKVVSEIIESFETHMIACATMVDLSKAFDSVSHDILLDKLVYHGIQENELSLIRSYLENRRQVVRIDNQYSNILKVLRGVPQGSVIGPFLFLVYVNDLPDYLPQTTVMYADDTTLITKDKCISKLYDLNDEMLAKSATWMLHNSLVLNHSKTETIYFHLSNIKTNINNKNTVKLLGIHLDTKLNWNAHTAQVCKKLSRSLFLLRKLKSCVSGSLLITAYYAYFHSHLLYGNMLWGNSTGAQTVFKWQKKAIRIIVGITDRESCRPYFKDLKIITVPSLYILNCLVHIKENYVKYVTRGSVHSYDTRQKFKLNTPYVRLSKSQNSYEHIGLKLYNMLPHTVRDMDVKNYIRYCKTWLIDRCIYGISEFEEEISR